MIIDPLVSQTLGRLAGITAFLDLLDRTLPESEWIDNEALKQVAEREGWEFVDFDIERQVLDERFSFWLPRFTAYSVITLLHTVVETQLLACAKRAASIRRASFRPDDMRGRGIDAAVTYLDRLGLYDVHSDAAWTTICDLRELRHLIVHRAGTKGESDQHRQTTRRLAKKYEPLLKFPDGDWSWYGEVWISLSLCRRFIAAVEEFFKRLLGVLEQARIQESGHSPA